MQVGGNVNSWDPGSGGNCPLTLCLASRYPEGSLGTLIATPSSQLRFRPEFLGRRGLTEVGQAWKPGRRAGGCPVEPLHVVAADWPKPNSDPELSSYPGSRKRAQPLIPGTGLKDKIYAFCFVFVFRLFFSGKESKWARAAPAVPRDLVLLYLRISLMGVT